MFLSRFVGLLANVDTSEGNSTENWTGRGMEQYLENKLGSYIHKRGTFRDIVAPKFGQLVHKYLSQIVQVFYFICHCIKFYFIQCLVSWFNLILGGISVQHDGYGNTT